MKKQIITVSSIALAVILLFTTYMVFLRDDGIETVGDPFYTLTESVKNELAETEDKVIIDIYGYDGADVDWERVYLFAQEVEKASKKIQVSTHSGSDDGFVGVRVSVDGESVDIPYEDFYKTLYDGTKYAFDGENLICNAIFSLTDKEEQEVELRPLPDYDVDGDKVISNGQPLMFPDLERKDISYLTISNQHGQYSVTAANDDFYFDVSGAIYYDAEMFSQLSTRCRRPVTHGKLKLPEDKSFADYGLDEKAPASGSYSLVTNVDADGNYTIHTVYIGDKSATGQYYFARYIGGVFKPSGKTGVSDELVYNLSKDFIYYLPVDAFDNAIGLPQTDIMSADIMNPQILNMFASDTSQLQEIGDIRIDLYKDGVEALARKIEALTRADNLACADTTEAAVKIVTDKKSATGEYSSYEGAWLNNLSTFGGFKVTSGSSSYLVAALARYPKSGEYKVTFGLVRDEENKAVTPKKFTVYKSSDGLNWHEIENGSVTVDQPDKSIKHYEITFTDEKPVKYIRISFDAPAGAVSFVVFDEVRIYGDGIDLQPTDSYLGLWKLVAPAEYIPEGYNYSYFDMTNFNNFVENFAQLSGERVVGCGFSDNGDATTINKGILAKFGLDNPEKHFSFEFKGVVTDLYVSAKTEEGKYNAYATFSGELDGKRLVATRDVIVELSEATVEWLSWNLVDYTNHAPIIMYINDIQQIDLTVDGVKYEFKLNFDSKGVSLNSVTHNGKEYPADNFKMFYESMLRVQMKGKFTPDESTEMDEWLRVYIHSDVKESEFVFYRVDSAKCYYTVDGIGGYYTLVSDINDIRNNLQKLLNGEAIGR